MRSNGVPPTEFSGGDLGVARTALLTPRRGKMEVFQDAAVPPDDSIPADRRIGAWCGIRWKKFRLPGPAADAVGGTKYAWIVNQSQQEGVLAGKIDQGYRDQNRQQALSRNEEHDDPRGEKRDAQHVSKDGEQDGAYAARSGLPCVRGEFAGEKTGGKNDYQPGDQDRRSDEQPD